MTDDSNLDATAAAVVRGLWLDTGEHDLLLAALTVAASRTDDDLDCVACDEGTCTDPDHNEPTVKIRQWRGLAQRLAVLRCGTKPVAVAYNRGAARRWLAEWAADEFGIDESFSTVKVTIVARLEDVLRALAWNAEPEVWATQPPLECVPRTKLHVSPTTEFTSATTPRTGPMRCPRTRRRRLSATNATTPSTQRLNTSSGTKTSVIDGSPSQRRHRALGRVGGGKGEETDPDQEVEDAQ